MRQFKKKLQLNNIFEIQKIADKASNLFGLPNTKIEIDPHYWWPAVYHDGIITLREFNLRSLAHELSHSRVSNHSYSQMLLEKHIYTFLRGNN